MGFLMRKNFSEEQNLNMPALLSAQKTCAKAQGADKIALDTLRDYRVDKTTENITYMMETWFQ